MSCLSPSPSVRATGRALAVLTVCLTSVPILTACFKTPGSDDNGSIRIAIGERFLSGTRGGFPDVNDFILEITDSKGGCIYDGSYRDSPDLFEVAAGSYTVSALSCPEGGPAFEMPQYGDTQVVVVPSGQCVSVQLICTQLNSGLKLSLKESFKEAFPEGRLKLKSGSGELEFGYDETRIAYFNPGTVALLLENSGQCETLFSRVLEPRQILSVNVGAMGGTSAAGVSIQLDTARTWTSENYRYGSGGGKVEDALDVAEARNSVGKQGVWVFGYIVGSASGSSGPSFTPPFSKNTNVAIAPRPGSSDKESCLSVELKSGAIRDAINLVENPSNLGRGIYLRGDIVESYFGIPGIKNVTEYQWKQ